MKHDTLFNIYCISYQRSDKILTKHLFECCTYLETNNGSPDKEKITREVERIAMLIYDLNIGLAFDQPTFAPYTYTAEFSFVGMPGHMRWINRKALKAVYDKYESATFDVDMMMQELLKNKIILQPKYLCVKAGMDLNAGSIMISRKKNLR